MGNEITVRDTEIAPRAMIDYALSPAEVLKQASLIQQVMNAVMKDGQHYGIIPGTSGKKSLLKAGAEKLCFVFGLSNRLEIETKELPNFHREVRVICNLFDRSGNLRGQGVGCASTLESKYRYRGAAGKVCPSCRASACKVSKKEYGGGYYCDSKAGGCDGRFKQASKEAKELDLIPAIRQENTDLADQYNTVLKMAKKRAMVDSILTATACSDLFTQDLEDLEDKIDHEEEKEKEKVVAAAKKAHAEPPIPAESLQTASQVIAEQKAKEPVKPKKSPEQHPGIKVALELFGLLPANFRISVLSRLNGLFGVKKAQDIPPEKLNDYEERATALLNLFKSSGEHGLDAVNDNLTAMEDQVKGEEDD